MLLVKDCGYAGRLQSLLPECPSWSGFMTKRRHYLRYCHMHMLLYFLHVPNSFFKYYLIFIMVYGYTLIPVYDSSQQR